MTNNDGRGADHGDQGQQGSGTNEGSNGQGHDDQFTIVVNGRSKKWTKDKISYDELVALSGLPLPEGPNPGFTITYHNGPDHSDGTVVPGQSVKVRNGMIFNVTPTNQS
ncbi:multiubiquitin domain-containing protein [Bradyrhizobium sp. Pa8]|uniref:multiubiquitin domain-containing protein n=1 Tax=Bradyrhizobium sp. Pa8 TaxID=3386552 RepID=UPI00403F9A13